MNTHKFRASADDIVFSGMGMITAHGYGLKLNQEALNKVPSRSSIEDYKVKGFQPGPHLSDRKVVKVVSSRDVLGLVAFEECVKNAGVRHEGMNPERTGLYVGAPPSSTSDYANYLEGIEATRNLDGDLVEGEFGNTYRSASPTTLLAGLPNNVLCYGSKTLDARGPNSNYTCLETSGHVSILGASRAMRLGRLDCAIAGGFSAHTDEVILTSLRRLGVLKSEGPKDYRIEPFSRGGSGGTIPAEGAVFVALERRECLESRGAKSFATLLSGGSASESAWPRGAITDSDTLKSLIEDTLEKSGIDAAEVAIIALSGSGLQTIDQIEKRAVTSVFKNPLPTLICTTRVWGNLMEAGGVADIAAMAQFCADGLVPEPVKVGWGVDQKKLEAGVDQIGLVIRTSAWGDYTCLLVLLEAAPKS